MTATQLITPTIHLFFAGREFRVDADELSAGMFSDDHDLRRELAQFLGVELSRLGDHVIHRHQNGDVTLRPRSVFER